MSALAAYDGLIRALVPLRPALLAWRTWRGKEDATRRHERLGRPDRPRPAGPLVWLHGASIGESLAALGLIEAIRARRGDVRIMVTTGTVTSAEILAERLPQGCWHQYVPVDQPGPVAGFLDHWRPDLALWMESDLWPMLLRARSRRQIPAALVNARLSERSFRRWQHFPESARTLLRTFVCALAQSDVDAQRLQALGMPAEGVTVLGNLKFAGAAPPAEARALASLQTALDGRPVWLAASTHPADHSAVLAAHARLRQRFPELVLLIAPRHPYRGAEIAHEAAQAGLTPLLRGEKRLLPQSDTAVYIVDTLGELGLFFRLAEIVYVGGGLPDGDGKAVGGHNPIEPAGLDSAVLFGPDMSSFPGVSEALLEEGAAAQVRGPDELAAGVDGLLSDAERRHAMAQAGQAVVARQRQGLLDRAMAALAPVFERAGIPL